MNAYNIAGDVIADIAGSRRLYIGPLQLGHATGNLINLTDSYANKRICMKDLLVFPTKYKRITIYFNEKYHINCLFGSEAYDMSSTPDLYTLNGNQYVTVSGSVFTLPEYINYYRFIVVLGSDHDHAFTQVPDDIGLYVEYEDKTDILQYGANAMQLITAAKGTKNLRSNTKNYYRPELFVIGHASDTHGDYQRTKNFLDFCDHIGADVAAVTGDILTTNTQSGINWFLELVNGMKRALPAICVGNHEVWPSNRAVFSDTDTYNEYFAPIAAKLQCTTGQSWYSVDFADKKIRMISINQYQDGYSTNRGYVHYKQDQITWLVSTLASTPQGYGVILLYHQPDGSSMPGVTAGYEKFYQQNDGYSGSTPIYGSFGYTLIGDIVDAFIGRTTLTRTYNQSGTPSSVPVDADFTSVATGAEFIAHLVGHCHRDKITYYPNVAHKQLICLITITNSIYARNYDSDYSENSDIIREIGTAAQDSFNVYVVDRVNKALKVIRVGSTKTYEMQDRDYMVIPYTD